MLNQKKKKKLPEKDFGNNRISAPPPLKNTSLFLDCSKTERSVKTLTDPKSILNFPYKLFWTIGKNKADDIF